MTGGFVNFLADVAEPNMGVVAGLGLGTVFAGLISLVVLLSIMNVIFSKIKTKEKFTPEVNTAVSAEDEKMDEETVAAVSSAIAEVLGRDVSGIRITSIKKIN